MLRPIRFLLAVLMSAVRDVTTIVRINLSARPQILMYCDRDIQESFIRTTLEECERNHRCVLVVNREKISEQYDWSAHMGRTVYRIGQKSLRFLRAPVLVSPETVTRLPVWGCRHRVHVPHSIVSFHMTYPPGAFEEFDVVFCCGEHHVAEMSALGTQSGRRRLLIPAGYGRMDVLARALDMHSARPADEPEDSRGRTILVAPSWFSGNVLESIGEELVEALLEGDYTVILRPHYKIAELNRALLDRLESRFASSARFVSESPLEPSTSLFRADLMISDYSGVAYEFAFLREKPVLFLDVPTKVRNPSWREIGTEPLELALRGRVGRIVAPRVDAILDGLDELGREAGRYRDSIRAERDRYCFNYRMCGEVSAAALERLVTGATVTADGSGS